MWGHPALEGVAIGNLVPPAIPGVTHEVKFAPIDAAASGDNTIVNAVPSRRIRVINVVMIAAGTVTARFESGASGTALTGQMTLAINTGFAPGRDPDGHFQTLPGQLLNLELSGAISVDGWLSYIEV